MAKKQQPDIFSRFTSRVSSVLGHAWIFISALIVLVLWGASGPLLGFSDTWQLIINTSTTIVTFLMVFIIQNTQNRDNLALNVKLDVMMEKLGIDADDIIEAEDQSDKRLETQVQRERQKASAGKKSTRRRRR